MAQSKYTVKNIKEAIGVLVKLGTQQLQEDFPFVTAESLFKINYHKSLFGAMLRFTLEDIEAGKVDYPEQEAKYYRSACKILLKRVATKINIVL